MAPYYFDLGRRLINNVLAAELTQMARQYRSEFIEYKTFATGRSDGNNFLTGRRLTSIPAVQNLVAAVTRPCQPVLMLHPAGTVVQRHVDDANSRNSVLITPLWPTNDFPPTRFYLEHALVAECHYPNGNTCLINTQICHDVAVSDRPRLNLQLGFNEDFDEILALLQKDRLVRL